MRFLFSSLHNYCDRTSGAAISTFEVLSELSKRGHSVHTLCGPLFDSKGIDTNSEVQTALDEYFRSIVARWFMNTLRKINMIAAPPLWFVEIFLLLELAYLAPHLHWLTPCCFLLAVLWLLTNVAWFLGVVDLIYHLFRWRTFQLWWFFPACLVNIFALKFFFKLKGYETFWMILHNLLSELGWRKY